MTKLNLEVGKSYFNLKGDCVTIISTGDYPSIGVMFIGVNHSDFSQYAYDPVGQNDVLWQESPNNLVSEATEEQVLTRSVKFSYTNYRGEHSIRTALIIKTDWGTTDWHPEPGYLLTALDFEKKQIRQFALKDCNFTKTEV